jgi:hypothetical protein
MNSDSNRFIQTLYEACVTNNTEIMTNIIMSEEGQKEIYDSHLKTDEVYRIISKLLERRDFDKVILLIGKCNIDINLLKPGRYNILFDITFWIEDCNDIVKFLIKNGVDTEYKSFRGCSFLDFIDEESKEEIKKLIEDTKIVNLKPARNKI